MLKITCFHHFFRTIDGVLTGSSFSATLPLQHPFPGTDPPSGLTLLAAASILECLSTIVMFCSHYFSFGVVGQSLLSMLPSWPSS